jgi:hypothetical protein
MGAVWGVCAIAQASILKRSVTTSQHSKSGHERARSKAMSKSNLIEQIMDEGCLRDMKKTPLSTAEAQDLVSLWDEFLMHFGGYDLADLPPKALKVMANIDKMLKEQKK